MFNFQNQLKNKKFTLNKKQLMLTFALKINFEC